MCVKKTLKQIINTLQNTKILLIAVLLSLSFMPSYVYAAAPVLSAATLNLTDTANYDTYAIIEGHFNATDADEDPISYTLVDSTTVPSGNVNGQGYNWVQNGSYGDLYLRTDGNYAFVPNASTINALTSNTSESFNIRATAGGETDENTYTVNITAINDTPTITTYVSTNDITTGLSDSAFSANGTSPTSEVVKYAFDDNVNTKYLNWGFNYPSSVNGAGTSVTIDAGAYYVVTSLGLTTANDADNRDPTSYTLYGSNDNSNFTQISSGSLTPPTARFTDFPTVSFANTTSYRYYKLTFNTLRVINSEVQVSEIRLGGETSNIIVYTENSLINALENIIVKDNENGNLVSATVRISSDYESAYDRLSFTNNNASLYGNISASFESSTGILSLSGSATVEQYQNALRAVTYQSLSENPTLHSSTRTLNWRVNDGTIDSNSAQSSITIVALNDAPTAQNDSFTLDEDSGIYLMSLDANDTDVDNDLNGTAITIISGPSHGEANVTANGFVQYLPSLNYNGVDSFTYTISDGLLNSSPATVSLNIIPVNDAPTITSNGANATASISLAENTTAVTTVTTTDAESNTITYAISGGADSSAFSINSATGVLAFSSAPNYEFPTDSNSDNIYVVEVNATDNGIPAMSDTQIITVTVTNVNEGTFTNDGGGSSITITPSENQSGATTIITTGLEGNITYTLGGVDAGSFAISDSGILTFIAAPDYETDSSYSVTVSATNGTDTITQTITITVTNENEAPSVSAIANYEKAEDFSSFDVNFTIADVDGDDLNVTILNNATDLVTTSYSGINPIAYSTYNGEVQTLTLNAVANKFGLATLQVVVKDQGGLLDMSEFNLSVPAVLDFPSLTNEQITLSEDFGSFDINLTNIDLGGAQSATISIAFATAGVLEAGNTITIQSGTTEANLSITSLPNATGETNATISVDNGTQQTQKTITISVTPVNDVPLISGTPLHAVENNAYSWTPTVSDVDNNVFTFSATNLPLWASLNSTTGTISGTPSLNDSGTYSNIIITVSDGNTTAELTTSITVFNSNQAPIDLSLSGSTLAENNSIGATIGTLSTTDADAGDTHTYSLTCNAPTGAENNFSITGNTLKAAVAFDYESKNSYSICIKTTDNAGASYEKSITITITDVAEATSSASSDQSSSSSSESASNSSAVAQSSSENGENNTHTSSASASSQNSLATGIIEVIENDQYPTHIIYFIDDMGNEINTTGISELPNTTIVQETDRVITSASLTLQDENAQTQVIHCVIEGSIDGTQTHRLTLNDTTGTPITTQATSQIIGTTTIIRSDGSIESVVLAPHQENQTVQTTLKVVTLNNGKTEHIIQKRDTLTGEITESRAAVLEAGAQTTITAEGLITTVLPQKLIEIEGKRVRVDAVVQTNSDAETITSFVLTDETTGETTLLNTNNPATPYEPGNITSIERDETGLLVIKTRTYVTRPLIFE